MCWKCEFCTKLPEFVQVIGIQKLNYTQVGKEVLKNRKLNK